jgi:hypothetical protein
MLVGSRRIEKWTSPNSDLDVRAMFDIITFLLERGSLRL